MEVEALKIAAQPPVEARCPASVEGSPAATWRAFTARARRPVAPEAPTGARTERAPAYRGPETTTPTPTARLQQVRGPGKRRSGGCGGRGEGPASRPCSARLRGSTSLPTPVLPRPHSLSNLGRVKERLESGALLPTPGAPPGLNSSLSGKEREDRGGGDGQKGDSAGDPRLRLQVLPLAPSETSHIGPSVVPTSLSPRPLPKFFVYTWSHLKHATSKSSCG